MHAPPSQMISMLVTALVVGLVLMLRLRTVHRARRLRPNTLWMVPAVLLLAFIVALAEHHPHDPLGWLWLALAAGVGAGLGWRRGMLMRISVDPASGTLSQQTSPAALLFFVMLILVRQGLRYEAAANGIDVLTITGILMAFAVGLVTATRAEMYLRAKRILAAGAA